MVGPIASAEVQETYGRTIIEIVYGLKDVRPSSLRDVLEKIAYRLLGIVSDVIHILLYSFQSVIVDD